MSYAIIECESRKIFKNISIEEVFDEVHIKIPKFKNKKSQKYAKKINKILKKHKVSNVVLSNELMENEVFKNVIYMQNNYIITGNKLYQSLLRKVLEDICSIVEVPLQTVSVEILCNEFSIENLDLVKYISQSVKQVTIMSENKEKFENIALELMSEAGIPLTVLENKTRTSAIGRTNFIINVDYGEEEIKKLIIPKDAIVISVRKKITELRKNFNGIIINDLNIYLGKEIQNFRTLALCEAYVYDYKRRNQENEKKFERSEYKINAYIGNNGIISEEEFKKIGKTFVKKSKNNT